jgi:hypothetical protein
MQCVCKRSRKLCLDERRALYCYLELLLIFVLLAQEDGYLTPQVKICLLPHETYCNAYAKPGS